MILLLLQLELLYDNLPGCIHIKKKRKLVQRPFSYDCCLMRKYCKYFGNSWYYYYCNLTPGEKSFKSHSFPSPHSLQLEQYCFSKILVDITNPNNGPYFVFERNFYVLCSTQQVLDSAQQGQTSLFCNGNWSPNSLQVKQLFLSGAFFLNFLREPISQSLVMVSTNIRGCLESVRNVGF